MDKFNYSIIIPHYNIPNLLIRCIKSIPCRDDVQVIIVDDNSLDSDKYVELYPELLRKNVEFYKTPQGGSAGRARNIGIDKAKGKWLIFADADDLFSDNVSLLLDKYVDSTEELLFFKFKSVYSEDINKISNRDGIIRKQMFEQEYSEVFLRCKVPLVWSRFFKREFVERNHFRFDETRWSNDYFFSVCCGCAAKKIRVVDEVLYIVTERTGSLVSKFCETEEEMRCRADVSFRVQKVLNASTYVIPKLAVSINLLLILQKHPQLFSEYMDKLKTINISKLRVVREMCSYCGRRGKVTLLFRIMYFTLKRFLL